MIPEEYLNMQEHLQYITGLIIQDIHLIHKVRGVIAFWDECENTAKIMFFYNGELLENELEELSIANTEIIAHCSNGKLKEEFVRLDYPKPLPESHFWGYKKPDKNRD